MKPPNVEQLVREALEAQGADGLCNPDHECFCALSELMHCRECVNDCIPAKVGKAPQWAIDEGEVEEGDDWIEPLAAPALGAP